MDPTPLDERPAADHPSREFLSAADDLLESAAQLICVQCDLLACTLIPPQTLGVLI